MSDYTVQCPTCPHPAHIGPCTGLHIYSAMNVIGLMLAAIDAALAASKPAPTEGEKEGV